MVTLKTPCKDGRQYPFHSCDNIDFKTKYLQLWFLLYVSVLLELNNIKPR